MYDLLRVLSSKQVKASSFIKVKRTCLISSVKLADPGITLKAFGHSCMLPVVHMRLSSGLTPPPLEIYLPPPHLLSTHEMTSAAAAIGSCLIVIGTVPA